MTDDLVKRLPHVGELTLPMWQDWLVRYNDVLTARERRIEQLEYALRSIAEAPSGCHPAFGAEIPDGTTVWKVVVHMQETAKYALKGDLEKGDQGENNLSRLDL